jgi:Cu/Ag efflux pump CusA
MLASGAGAEIRHALGTVVFSGMLGVTFFGLLLTPVFYVLIRRRTARGQEPAASASGGQFSVAAEGGVHG